jgi:hypothetical protein
MNARQDYAELARHFFAGRITNHEYERACDQILEHSDDAINQVYCQLWTAYCDFREHRMGRKHGMTREGRRLLARWIMFLKSDRPYEYPIRGCLPTLIKWLSLGLIRKPDPMLCGDSDYCPYFRRSDFDCGLENPRYLAG